MQHVENWIKLPAFYHQNQHITLQNNLAKKSSSGERKEGKLHKY